LAVCGYGSYEDITLNDSTEIDGVSWEVIKLLESVDAQTDDFLETQRYLDYTPRQKALADALLGA